MLLIILFMFHTVEQNVIILISHRLAYLLEPNCTKAKKTIWGLGEDGES